MAIRNLNLHPQNYEVQIKVRDYDLQAGYANVEMELGGDIATHTFTPEDAEQLGIWFLELANAFKRDTESQTPITEGNNMATTKVKKKVAKKSAKKTAKRGRPAKVTKK